MTPTLEQLALQVNYSLPATPSEITPALNFVFIIHILLKIVLPNMDVSLNNMLLHLSVSEIYKNSLLYCSVFLGFLFSSYSLYVSKIHLYFCMQLQIIHFHSWITFYVIFSPTIYLCISLSMLFSVFFFFISKNAVRIHLANIFLCTCARVSLGYIQRSGIYSSQNVVIFCFAKYCRIVFQSGCTNSYFHLQLKVPPLLHISSNTLNYQI